jgi:hypothetical protein
VASAPGWKENVRTPSASYSKCRNSVKRFTAVFVLWYDDAPGYVSAEPTEDVLMTVRRTGRAGRASAACRAVRAGRNVPRTLTSQLFHQSAASASCMRIHGET